MLFFCSFVFHYYYIDPHDLLSFPTRRSSDLGLVDHVPYSAAVAICPCLSSRRIDDHHIDDDRFIRFGRHLLPLVQATGRRDRKSTRLNSSHVAISYAVFCLKKKKLN